jgi:hypothetical protein
MKKDELNFDGGRKKRDKTTEKEETKLFGIV